MRGKPPQKASHFLYSGLPGLADFLILEIILFLKGVQSCGRAILIYTKEVSSTIESTNHDKSSDPACSAPGCAK
jgi:hypothetical protein